MSMQESSRSCLKRPSNSDEHHGGKRRRHNAADKERERLRAFNDALGALQNVLPIRLTGNRKFYKKQTLRLAIRYIHFLHDCLDGRRDWNERSRFWFRTDSDCSSRNNVQVAGSASQLQTVHDCGSGDVSSASWELAKKHNSLEAPAFRACKLYEVFHARDTCCASRLADTRERNLTTAPASLRHCSNSCVQQRSIYYEAGSQCVPQFTTANQSPNCLEPTSEVARYQEISMWTKPCVRETQPLCFCQKNVSNVASVNNALGKSNSDLSAECVYVDKKNFGQSSG